MTPEGGSAFVTGGTGLVGSHLAEYVLADHPEVEVHGLVRWRSPRDHIRDIQDRVTLHEAELRDLNSLVLLLDRLRPDRIFHLAAQSYVSCSFTAPADTLQTNVIGATNLLGQAMIGEYVGRIYEQAKGRPLYLIDRVHAHGGGARGAAPTSGGDGDDEQPER